MPDLLWSPEAAPGTGSSNFDPYAEWKLCYGRAWDATARVRRESTDDFNWQAVMETHTAADIGELPEPLPGPATSIPVVPLRSGKVTEKQARSATLYIEPLGETPPPGVAPEAGSGGQAAASETLLTRARFRAPLRAVSIAHGAHAEARYDKQGLSETRATLVGVIDDAINPLHERFQLPGDRTRVEFAWSQGAAARASGCVPFGRSYSRKELEAELAVPGLTEEERMRRLGLVDIAVPGPTPLSRRLSHGTHVADLAAGFAPSEAPEDLRLALVSLPPLVTLETSGSTLAPFTIAALDYILDRALQMSIEEGFPIPVVVNFSYAIGGGPHNGLHIIETAIDALVASYLDRLREALPTKPDRRTAHVVVPAGNSYLNRAHAVAKAPDGGGETTLALDWRLAPGDETDNLLELWMPRDAKDVSLYVTTPSGDRVHLAGLNADQPLLLHPKGAPEGVIGRAAKVAQEGSDSDGVQRLKGILLALAPTAQMTASSHPVAPSGRWHVELKATLEAGERLRAWVQRDEAPAGYSRPGRASWLEHPAYRLYCEKGKINEEDQPDCPVKRLGSMSGIATGNENTTTVTSGWLGLQLDQTDDKEDEEEFNSTRPTPYVSAGDDGIRNAGISCQTDRTFALPGVIAAGTRSGSRIAMGGSSVAAPQETRRRALDHLGLPNPVGPVVTLKEAHPRLGGRLLPAK
ncbi:MAG: hypothetical protein AAFR47_00450 [Pseudomonadota bacterium]